jgi:hypothetical protein
MPVWGFAEVAESRADGLEPGTRLYGYLPPASELLVKPARIDARGFLDAAPHRAALPAAYNSYARNDGDPFYEEGQEDRQMLLLPLFYTSWLLADLLEDANTFGAGVVLISSASSRTGSALAYLLSLGRAGEIVGLTAARNRSFVERLGVYDHVLSYEELEDLPAGRAAYIDMAGDAEVRAAVHRHYGAELTHSAVVGATHHDRMGEVPEDLPGPRPVFFFAPARLETRTRDWGRAGVQQRIADSWRGYRSWTEGWLSVREGGSAALAPAYLELLDGGTDPSAAQVIVP